MKKIKLDTGLMAYEIGCGVLRFNPHDPNVYMRFQDAMAKLSALEEAALADETSSVLEKLQDMDKKVKALLGEIFGPGNDFDAICGGVSLFAADEKGVRLLEKLLAALEPVLLEGARKCAEK